MSCTHLDGWYFAGTWSFDSGATVVGDFNGDGKTDFCHLGATYMHIFISKGDGQYYYPVYYFPDGWNFGTDENVWTSLKAIDLNGDNKADILRTVSIVYTGVYTFDCYFSFYVGHVCHIKLVLFWFFFFFFLQYGTYNHAFFSQGTNENCWYVNNRIPADCFKVTAFRYPNGWNFVNLWSWNSKARIQGDFNGDGKQDFAHLGATYMYMFISKGDGQFHYPIYQYPSGWDFGWDENVWTSAALDYSGDCRTDIIRNSGTYHHGFMIVGEDECWMKDGWIDQSCITISTYRYPSGWNFAGGWTWNSRAYLQGDFNGDGKKDFARVGGTYIHFFISKGDGQFHYPIYHFPSGWDFTFDENVWTTLPAADFDGDGRDDIIRTAGTYNHGMMSRGTDGDCWFRDGWIDSSCMAITTFQYPGYTFESSIEFFFCSCV